MKTYTFLEWVSTKEQLDEAGVMSRRNSMSHDVQATPSVGDVVISNPKSFFDKVLYVPKGKGAEEKSPKLRDTFVHSQDFSSWKIKNISDKAIETDRLIHGTYASRAQGAEKGFHPSRLRDVTDSFEKGNKRYFVDLGRSSEIEKLYRIYQNLTKDQMSRTDLEDLAVKSVLGGDEPSDRRPERTMGQQAAAHASSQRGNDVKYDQWMQMNQAVKSGADLTHHPEVRDSILTDPDHVAWLRRIRANELVDLFHDKGYEVAGEKYRKYDDQPAAPQSPLDQLVGQPDRQPNQPEYELQGRNVVPIAKDLNDLVRRNQMRHGTFQQQPEDDLEVAWYNPSNDKHWKTNSDRKVYRYYSG